MKNNQTNDTVTVTLTERELDLLMYVVCGYAARAKKEAAFGVRDKDKTQDLTDRLCDINSKLYRVMLDHCS